MSLTTFHTFFIERKYPQCGDYIKITSLEREKHFIGIEGNVTSFKSGFLSLENGNTKYIISLKKNKLQYEFKGQKYKI